MSDLRFSRKKIDNSAEDKFLTGLIISDSFCAEIIPIYKKEYLTNSFSKIISEWCIDFYTDYNKSCGQEIGTIFERNKHRLKEEEQELISSFLDKLSKNFEKESGEFNGFNVEYAKDITKGYFNKRSSFILGSELILCSENNDIEKVQKLIRTHNTISKDISPTCSLFTEEAHIKTHAKKGENDLFTLSGDIGSIFPVFSRGELYSVVAPTKRGKSNWLIYFLLEAVYNKKSVLFISIEMTEEEINLRVEKAFTGRSYKDGYSKYPLLDCLHNQTGMCNRKERENKITVNYDGENEDYRDEKYKKYKTCVKCLDHEVNEFGINPMEKYYEEAVWWIDKENKKMKTKEYFKKLKKFRTIMKPNARIWSPSSSPTIEQIKERLKQIEYAEDFVPDVIVIDYADIIKPDKSSHDLKTFGDVYWGLKEITKERKCLVVTASQTNRESMNAHTILDTQISDDYHKNLHVDGYMLLHQVPDEKEDRIMRVSASLIRKEGFDSRQQVMVLQCIELGQVCIDSKKMTIRKTTGKNNY